MFQETSGGPLYANGATLNPHVPYHESLEDMKYGDVVIVQGWVPHKSKWFSINLKDDFGDGKINIVLSINPRFEKKEMVLNTQREGRWGVEEKAGLGPLKHDHHFQCVILAHEDCFKISLNGKHHTKYLYRLAHSDVNMIGIEGEVAVTSVLHHQVTRSGSHSDGKISAMPSLPDLKTISNDLAFKNANENNDDENIKENGCEHYDDNENNNLSLPAEYDLVVPYSKELPGGLTKGRVIYMCLVPLSDKKEFSISLKQNSDEFCDMAFCFEANMEHKKMSCRSLAIGEINGKEHVIHADFPFRNGVHADIILRREPQELWMSINNCHLLQFPNRFDDMDVFSRLEVKGCVHLVHVRWQ